MPNLVLHILVATNSESEAKLKEELDEAEVPDLFLELLSEISTDKHYKAHLYGNESTSEDSHTPNDPR